jgi:hypothetical protein
MVDTRCCVRECPGDLESAAFKTLDLPKKGPQQTACQGMSRASERQYDTKKKTAAGQYEHVPAMMKAILILMLMSW